MSNNLDSEKVKAISNLVLAGESLRYISKELHVAKNSVARHKRLLLPVLISKGIRRISCGCGEAAGHKGWCRFRLLRSPARQVFLASWVKTPLIIIKRTMSNQPALDALIRKQLPPGFIPEIRDDLVNDLVVSVLSGEISLEQIPEAIKTHATKARKFMYNKFRDVSIDAPVSGYEDCALVDILEAPEPYEEAEDL